jgi:hypothetical protein
VRKITVPGGDLGPFVPPALPVHMLAKVTQMGG